MRLNRTASRATVHYEDDRGVALIVALVVTLIVFIFTTAILADAFFNVVGSANARERLTAINAAEAGVAWYAHGLEASSVESLRTAPWSGSANTWTSAPRNLEGMPGRGSFTVTATYWRSYDSATDVFSGSPCVSGCASFADMNSASAPPVMWVELQSTGHAGRVARTVRAVLEVRPVHAALQGAFAGLFICELGNRFTITGPNADLYLIGDPSNNGCSTNDLRVTSGQFTTSGDVYVLDGQAILQRSSKIDGDLWAKKGIFLGSGLSFTTNTQDTGACASTTAPVLVCGNATSLLSKSKTTTSKVLGTFSVCGSCQLPGISFAQIPTSSPVASDTTAVTAFPSPWVRVNASAVSTTWFSSTPSTSKTLYVLGETLVAGSTCSRWTMPTGTLYLPNDVAIVSPCGFSFGGRVEFRKAPGLTGTPTLYLMSGYTSATCGTDPSNYRRPMDQRDIVFSQNFEASAVRVYVYTPCKLIVTNQTNITGQILARQLYAQGRTTINTVGLLGLSGNQPGPVTSFSSRVLNLRED